MYEEVVVRGLEADHPDARRIERAVESGVLEVVSVPATDTFDSLQENDRLSTADATVLATVSARDGIAVMDEQYGRDVADTEAIATRGTPYLVLRLLSTDAITVSDARETIDAMVEEGWYVAPDRYATILQKIDEPA